MGGYCTAGRVRATGCLRHKQSKEAFSRGFNVLTYFCCQHTTEKIRPDSALLLWCCTSGSRRANAAIECPRATYGRFMRRDDLNVQQEHCHVPPPPASAMRATDLLLDDDSDAVPHEEMASRRAQCPAAPAAAAEGVRSVADVHLDDDV